MAYRVRACNSIGILESVCGGVAREGPDTDQLASFHFEF